MIVFAAIAPHGDLDLAPELRSAMEELGRRFAAAAPDAAIVVTPHNVHVEDHFAVITASHVGEWETDRELAQALLAADLPILGVSYGGNDASQAEMPLDWGTEVPLTSMHARRVVVVAPARDRPFEEHLRLGRTIAGLPGRHALIASADHGHAHAQPTGRTASIPPPRCMTTSCSRSSAPAGSTSGRWPSTSDDGQGGLALAAPRPPGRHGRGRGGGHARLRGADVLRDGGRGGISLGKAKNPGMAPAKRTRRRTPAKKKRSLPRGFVKRYPELWGLGVVAFGAFLGSVRYAGWNGGWLGHALVDGFETLIGGASWVLPVLLVALGSLMVARSALVDVRPFRAGLVVLSFGLMIALGRDQGGYLGQVLGGAVGVAIGVTGSTILGAFLLLVGALLLSGASLGAMLRGSHRQMRLAATRARRPRPAAAPAAARAAATRRRRSPSSTQRRPIRTSSPRWRPRRRR